MILISSQAPTGLALVCVLAGEDSRLRGESTPQPQVLASPAPRVIGLGSMAWTDGWHGERTGLGLMAWDWWVVA